jgi:phosphatidylglycerophosphate synthase
MKKWLFNYLNQHNISKRKIFEKYNDIWTLKDMGAGFTGRYISLITTIGIWGMIFKILFGMEIEVLGQWLILAIVANILLDIWVGHQYIKSGLLEYSRNYEIKKKHLSPQWVELISTLKKICKKLGIDDDFTPL